MFFFLNADFFKKNASRKRHYLQMPEVGQSISTTIGKVLHANKKRYSDFHHTLQNKQVQKKKHIHK